jgi:hypothetical protein
MLVRCALVCCLVTGVSYADYQETRTLTLDSKNLSNFKVDVGAGSLSIVGVPNTDTITVKATIHIGSSSDSKAERYIKDYLELRLTARGDRAVLVSDFDNDWSITKWIGGNVNSRVDIELTMPQIMNLDVNDGSGSMEIRNVMGKVDIDDGSGNIELETIGGDVKIDDGSGSIDVKSVKGDVDIDDGSGNADLEHIIGSVVIDDGSGSITIKDVTGSVEIDDGSGNIKVDHVSENVNIIDNGSGSSRISNVDGWIKERT